MKMQDKQQTENVQEKVLLIGERKMTVSDFLIRFNAPIILVILIVISSLISPIFLTRVNIVNVLRQQTGYIIIAMGLLMTLLTGGIDLSVASLVGFGSIMITELVTVHDWTVWSAIALTILLSAGFGSISGFLIAYLNMQPFIVTLSMSFAVQGVVFIVSKGVNRMLTGSDPFITVFKAFGQRNDAVFGLPYRIYLTVMIVVFFWWMLKYTAYGRLMYAVGSNRVAVSLAGIDVRKYRLSGNIFSSAFAGMAGILITASNGGSSPSTVQGDYTMTAIAGAIIGGGDLGGGRGSVPLTVVGIFVMGLINNIMNLRNVPAYPQWVVKSIVIIIAIFMRSYINTRQK